MPAKRITIIPRIHGKLTHDRKLSEPDIYWILEKWLQRHPEIKGRERDIQITVAAAKEIVAEARKKGKRRAKPIPADKLTLRLVNVTFGRLPMPRIFLAFLLLMVPNLTRGIGHESRN